MLYRFQNETSQNVQQMQYMNSRIQKVHIVQTDNLPLLLPRIKHETCYSVAEKRNQQQNKSLFLLPNIIVGIWNIVKIFLLRTCFSSNLSSFQSYMLHIAFSSNCRNHKNSDANNCNRPNLLSLGFYLNLLYNKKIPKSIGTLGLIYIILYFQIL